MAGVSDDPESVLIIDTVWKDSKLTRRSVRDPNFLISDRRSLEAGQKAVRGEEITYRDKPE